MAASSPASACRLRTASGTRHAWLPHAQASPSRTALVSRTLDLAQSRRRLPQRSFQRRAAVVQASNSLQPSPQGSRSPEDSARLRACSGSSQEAGPSGTASFDAGFVDCLRAEGSPEASGSAAAGVDSEQRSGGGSVLGAIALITGTSVGAGMLALPSETAPAVSKNLWPLLSRRLPIVLVHALGVLRRGVWAGSSVSCLLFPAPG